MAALTALAFAVTARADLPPLIPRTVLFSNPERTAPQISPNGKTIALLKPSKEGVLNVWIRPLNGGAEKMVTRDTGSGVSSYRWSADGRRILFFQDRHGDEVQHLFSVDMTTKVVRDLTPLQGVRAQNLILAAGKPDEVLVGLNLRKPHLFDMYRVDLNSGSLTRDTENPGDVLSWTADYKLNIRACSAIDPKDASTSIRTRSSAKAPWKTILNVPFEQSLQLAQQNGGTSIVGFNSSGRSLYVVTALGTDTSRLLRLDSSTGRIREEVTPVRGADIDTIYDVSGDEKYAVLADPELKHIQAVGYNYQKLEWKVAEPAYKADIDALAKFRDADFQILNKDATDTKWVVEYTSDVAPRLFTVYDRSTKKSTVLFEDQPELKKHTLAPMRLIGLRARDETRLLGYLTLPVGAPEKGLPLILVPHGGPWRRDHWGFDPVVQLLANRGYAVLQVNFRGSTGYGTKFLNAATGGWGIGSMQNDLTDAVHWAIAQGIADPARVGVLGASYGGYATLSAIAFTPDLYACAVDLVGPSDVSTLVDSLPDYWGPVKRRWIRRIGLDVHGKDFAKRISPVNYAAEMRAPLLIGHGANDPRVKLQHSEKLVEEMRRRERDVTFVVYPDEGHGFSRPENNLDFFGRVEEFLAKHLGGRAEPHQDVKGSTAQTR